MRIRSQVLVALASWSILAGSTQAVAEAAPKKRWAVPKVPARFYRPAPKRFRDRKCLRLLRSLRVPFRRVRRIKGVATPVLIRGKRIGRIRYKQRYKGSKQKLLMDCRLAVALRRASDILWANNIRTIIHSNFYSWRYVAGSGRLSRHALGLAIDIFGFIDARGRRMSILKDYEKGLGYGRTCEGNAKTIKGRILRDLSCDLDASNVFEAILTPDYDKGHADHLHISVWHPQDRKRYRLLRTVLMETRGTMYAWTKGLPRKGWYKSRRIRIVIRRRARRRRIWHKRRKAKARRRRHKRSRR